jgi:hypothetical protein
LRGEWRPRHELAAKRLHNILRAHVVATARILEQKISDAGPANQRIDPHILTDARSVLENSGIIKRTMVTGIPWYYLASTNPTAVEASLGELAPLHSRTQHHTFTQLVGQALEIAVFRALLSQNTLHYFGHFHDLDAHDDSTLYRKEEPPSSLSGRQIPGGKKLDFLVQHPQAGYAGIEVKNIREWMHPDREEIREMLFKCCSLDVVPVLIVRRFAYSTFSVLHDCGVIVTPRMPFPDSNGRSEAGYGRSGMRPRSGKPRSLARCSIGCWNWVVRSPIRPADSGVQGTISASSRFMQQSPTL